MTAIRRQIGITMVEVVITLAIFFLILAFSAGALSHYLAQRSLDVAVRDLNTQIKEAQQLALTTGNTYRVDFSNPPTYQLKYRSGSGIWIDTRAPKSLPGGIYYGNAEFGTAPALHPYLECSARGACEDGQITLTSNRFGAFGMLKTVRVQGETVNVTAS